MITIGSAIESRKLILASDRQFELIDHETAKIRVEWLTVKALRAFIVYVINEYGIVIHRAVIEVRYEGSNEFSVVISGAEGKIRFTPRFVMTSEDDGKPNPNFSGYKWNVNSGDSYDNLIDAIIEVGGVKEAE